MTCANCGAAMQLDPAADFFACRYCGNRHFPDADEQGLRALEPAENLDCPVCHRELWHAALGGIRLLRCQNCRGMLIGMDEFVALVDAGLGPRAARARAFDEGELARRIRCPRCHESMHTHPYGGPGNIVIDNCPRCRLNWLDPTELQRVTRP